MDWLEYSAPMLDERYGPLDVGSIWSEDSATDKLVFKGPIVLVNDNYQENKAVRPVLNPQYLVRLAPRQWLQY